MIPVSAATRGLGDPKQYSNTSITTFFYDFIQLFSYSGKVQTLELRTQVYFGNNDSRGRYLHRAGRAIFISQEHFSRS